MKKIILYIICFLFILPQLMSKYGDSEYIIISWNEDGMHFSNKDFSNIALLPPGNNLRAQVIKRGSQTNLPQIVTSGVKVTYEIPGNTYSVGKTNFWDYVNLLYNRSIPKNEGLTGNGLTGEMKIKDNYFIAEGIPVTPYTDADQTKEDPYQQALVKLYDGTNNLLFTSKPVIPASNEIGCVSSGCHGSEQSIIDGHPNEFDKNNKPIFCASCHPSTASGLVPSTNEGVLSFRIHNRHTFINDNCYKCHPGPNTKFLRDYMFQLGKNCVDCHGNVSKVYQTIRNGRKPWTQEPSCGDGNCHKSGYIPEAGKLYRDSKGHGGLFCSACHGSPHAIYPTVNPRDNEQNISLQGFEGKLKECKVCHGVTPNMPGPHGYLPTSVNQNNSYETQTSLMPNYPNPVKDKTTFKFRIKSSGYVRIDIYNLKGNKEVTLINENLEPGEYQTILDAHFLSNGLYSCILNVNNQNLTQIKMFVNK